MGGMARAAQGRSRDNAANLRRIVLHECGGLALVGIAAFGALALWTYDPSDPVLTREPVGNAGGALGAALAAGLLRTFGLASVLAVAAVGVLGTRLVAGRGLPRISSRFWAGVTCLVLALSALPPLVGQAMPQHADLVEVGWLGAQLARLQSWIFGTWGAIVLNTAILAMGIAIASPASATSILSACGMALGRGLGGFVTLCMRAGQAAAAVPSQLRLAAHWISTNGAEGWRSAGVWREQRARRARVAAARDEREGEEEPEQHCSRSGRRARTW